MTWTSQHIDNWLVDTGKCLTTKDGRKVVILEFQHQKDNNILSSWAKHFRNHYCLDTMIDSLRGRRTRQEYLTDIKFPSQKTNLGPSIRAGDFVEILIADYLQWMLDFIVPRVRWSAKEVRDESPKGCDVIGFQFQREDGRASEKDVLAVFETKAKLSRTTKNRLQEAIKDSAKDKNRLDESLNSIKQKLLDRNESEQADVVDRFQNPVDFQYRMKYGAAAVISEEYFSDTDVTSIDCRKIAHPDRKNLTIVIIKGIGIMELVHELYRRAADEA